MIANTDIRQKAKAQKVCLWRVAAKLNISDGNFSRKLRNELSAAEKEKIIRIIDELAEEEKENKHDTGATEKWYNYVEQIRNRTIKHNLYRLLSIILQVGYNNMTISNCPSFKIHFSSLWLQPNLGKKYHQENKTIAYVKAMKQLAIARKEGIYVRMGAMTPAEVRRGLAKDSDFDIAALIDKEDILT